MQDLKLFEVVLKFLLTISKSLNIFNDYSTTIRAIIKWHYKYNRATCVLVAILQISSYIYKIDKVWGQRGGVLKMESLEKRACRNAVNYSVEIECKFRSND